MLACLLTAAVVVAGCVRPAPPLTRNATGPVDAAPLADPAVLKIGDTYHAWGTGYTGWPHYRIVYKHSTNGLGDWSETTDAMPTAPSWARSGLGANHWAPSVLQTSAGDYLMYFTAQTRNMYAVVNGVPKGPVWCIGVARAPAPEGPFEDAIGKPLVCQHQLFGSIDPDVFYDPVGRRLHLYWKSEGHIIGGKATIWHQPLSLSGLALTGVRTALLTPSQPWEGAVLENPAMVHRDGRYWLFYSGNDWTNAKYGTGVAHCATPAGGCVRSWNNAMLRTQRNIAGPGGAVPVRGQEGLLAFAAWEPTKVGYLSGGQRRLYFVNWYTWGGAPYAR